MTKLLLAMVLIALPTFCDPAPDNETDSASSQDAPQDIASLNVNARYIVESYAISGRPKPHLSDPLKSDLNGVVGKNLDKSLLERLADRIKKELLVPDVKVSVAKADMPEHVTVNFEIKERRNYDLDLSRFLYHSKQGWSGQGGVSFHEHGNTFRFGMLSDGDRLSERYAGIQASYERRDVIPERLNLQFQFSSYHEQWNRATLFQAAPDEIYRTRQQFTPQATLIIVRPLELSFGVDFARYRLTTPVARTESSNAVVSTLRYHQRWGSVLDSGEQDLQASYSLRSGTGVLESDRIFTRQMADVRYRFRHGKTGVLVSFLGGGISGDAPLFERFVLGNAETLRGWNKFDLDPLGASHVVHGSIEYSYDGFLVFYDTGAAWDRAQDREQKQSLGLGCKSHGFQVAVAFPVRSGQVDPVFYAGMNF